VLDGRIIEEEELKKGSFLKPSILECTPDNYLFKEETFGPIFAITKFKDVEEGISIANDSEYGLSGIVITNDLEKGEYVAR
jgi:acyl-CoA reductase-like NAD-dependent aldehyde dehydrogenase